MSDHTRWQDIRAKLVERAGGEEVVAAETARLLAETTGHRLAELRKARASPSKKLLSE